MRQLITVFITTCFLFSIFSLEDSKNVVNAEQVRKEHRVTMILNSRQLYQNGSMYLSASPHVAKDGVTYISIRALGERLGFKISYDAKTKKSVMEKGNNRLAISQTGNSYEFNGKLHIYKNGAKPYVIQGTVMVPLRDLVTMFGIQPIPKLSENKVELVWTEWVEVGTPQPPALVASFETSKSEYKIGEPITYTDTSHAIGSSIVNRKWINNEIAFFEPGLQTIFLEVSNSRGEVNTTSRTILISNEVMYTKREYNEKFTPIGDKLPIERHEVLTYKVVPFQLLENDFPLIRSNSPETIVDEGIYYEDTLDGNMRFLIHNKNARPKPVKIYLIAKNEGTETATVTVNNLGMFGPVKYVSYAGRSSVANYLTSIQQKSIIDTITVEPNRTEVIIPAINSRSIPNENVLTVYADVFSNKKLTFQVVVLDEINELMRTLPFLNDVNASRDGIHTRGTFEKGNRELRVSQLVGNEQGRIIIGDGVNDRYVTGFDRISNQPEIGYGNFGVLYDLVLERVAPNTALILNPRGGQYAGAFLVNGQLVYGPTAGIFESPNEGAVLYRTGKTEEKVTIRFTPAAGGNLPLNILTIPLKVVE